jgi:regulator of cell morphogenesis and NO signaling
MKTLESMTVGNIVADDYRKAAVFKKFGIDFCCGGKNTLSEACSKKGLDINKVLEEIDKLSGQSGNRHRYKEWSPSFLVDFIINNHHHFVRTKLPEIKTYAKKVAKVHGRTYPKLDEMLETFLILNKEMLSHLDAEENILFPYIKKMEKAHRNGKTIGGKQQPDSAGQAIQMMEEEHDEAGALMARLEDLSNGFTPPEDACATFRVYFKNLEGFRDDLHRHVHLENNILFPKALELEQRFSKL